MHFENTPTEVLVVLDFFVCVCSPHPWPPFLTVWSNVSCTSSESMNCASVRSVLCRAFLEEEKKKGGKCRGQKSMRLFVRLPSNHQKVSSVKPDVSVMGPSSACPLSPGSHFTGGRAH